MPGSQSFLENLVGEWVGVTEQSTDGEQAENKYFHALIEKSGPESFSGKFQYFRYDAESGKPIPAGKATLEMTVGPNGVLTNRIAGDGTVLVQDKPREQQHELIEELTVFDAKLIGRIEGSINVNGLPFGLGRNGKIYDGTSEWSIENDFLIIRQSLKAGFRVLFVNKSFTIEANNLASRGSDLLAFMEQNPITERSVEGS